MGDPADVEAPFSPRRDPGGKTTMGEKRTRAKQKTRPTQGICTEQLKKHEAKIKKDRWESGLIGGPFSAKDRSICYL